MPTHGHVTLLSPKTGRVCVVRYRGDVEPRHDAPLRRAAWEAALRGLGPGWRRATRRDADAVRWAIAMGEVAELDA